MREGFHGPKSRIFGSETGTDVYFVNAAANGNFSCTCLMYKTYHVCSHSLLSAHDNKGLQKFIKLALKKPIKLTPAATFKWVWPIS